MPRSLPLRGTVMQSDHPHSGQLAFMVLENAARDSFRQFWAFQALASGRYSQHSATSGPRTGALGGGLRSTAWIQDMGQQTNPLTPAFEAVRLAAFP